MNVNFWEALKTEFFKEKEAYKEVQVIPFMLLL